METAFFPTARFVAFPDEVPGDAAAVPVFLRDVEDLHDRPQCWIQRKSNCETAERRNCGTTNCLSRRTRS
jgi:hypothetical protein